jgi:hypothetical protein
MSERKPSRYTTTIKARRTAGECVDLLADAGAARVAIEMTDRKPTGLSFRLDMAGQWQDFVMPVDVDAMQAVLVKACKPGGALAKMGGTRGARPVELARWQTREHAADVAWRVVLNWLEAQLALIDADMAKLDQVMLPYLAVDGGTLYEVIRDKHLALPRGAS